MPSSEPRPRVVGSKVTENEYTELEKLARSRSMTLSEWSREVLLAQLNPDRARPSEEIILAEILGTRMILLNTVYALANGEKLSSTEMQALILRVDQEKGSSAVERLARIGKKLNGEGSR